MADDSNKGSKLGTIIILLIAIAAIVLGYLHYSGQLRLQDLLGTVQESAENLEEEITEEQANLSEENETSGNVEMITALPATQEMLRERVLGFAGGDRIKITEHSSFTCSHCGNFHRETFEQLKNEYLKTGKAYLVFSDFPLNAPALYVSMVARCVPETQYFDFVQTLFEKQEDWAYETDYLDFLKSESAKFGLPENLYQECIDNEELRGGLLIRMQEMQTENNVRSTPTFVINDKGVIAGALPYDQFKNALEAAVAPAPASSEPAAGSDDAE